MKRFLTARESANKLDITLPTLYAYVSRGLIRSEPTNTRQKRYYAEDVQALLDKKEAARHPEKVAETALNWGTPVLESRLSLIADNCLYYRGRDATELALDHDFEVVAAWLWLGDETRADDLLKQAINIEPYLRRLTQTEPQSMSDVPCVQMLMAMLAADDVAAYDLRSGSVYQTGTRIIHSVTQLATGNAKGRKPVALTLRDGWCPNDVKAERLLNAALILLADHELNASSFTARIVASAGASPYGVVIAALSTFQGIKHGGSVERVGAFLQEVTVSGRIMETVAGRLRRGDDFPGFGHRLYPEGDPRAACLFDLMKRDNLNSGALAESLAVVDAVANLIDEAPNVDFALATLARVLGLSMQQAMMIFAIGRIVGWIGHAAEQYHDNRLIRPRARYTGPLPED